MQKAHKINDVFAIGKHDLMLQEAKAYVFLALVKTE